MSGSSLGGAALVLGLLVGGCGNAGAPSPAPAASGFDLAADAGVAPSDEIDGLDLVVDARGTVHVVWRQRDANATSGRIFYRRGSGSPLRWGPPVMLATAVDGGPQVAAAPEGAHVLAGSRLRHWLVDDNGVATALGERLAEGGQRAAGFDAIAADGGVVVVFDAAGRRARPVLHGLRWTPDGATGVLSIDSAAGASASPRIAPRLLHSGGRLMALWTVSRPEKTFDGATGVTAFRAAAEIRAAWSGDAGRAWQSAASVASVGGSDIADIAVASVNGAPVALLAAHGLFETRWTGNGWSPVVQVADHARLPRGGATEVTAVDAAACDAGLAMVWVDARHRRTDRRWWNPLGGVPWSDNPDWANNDAFLDMSSRAASAGGRARPPRRLTADGSYTGAIVIARRGAELVVLHAGRANVGKSRRDGGTPPRILHARFSCG